MRSSAGVLPSSILGHRQLGSGRSLLFADFDGDGFADSYHSVSAYRHTSFYGNQLHPRTASWPRFRPHIIYHVLPDSRFWYNENGRAVEDFKATLIRDLDNDGKPDIVTGACADITPFCDPAPADFTVEGLGVRALDLLPSESGLHGSARNSHEYVGLITYSARIRLGRS